MDNETLSIIVIVVILFFIVFFIVRNAIKIRRSGGSFVTTMHGSTYEFLNDEKRKAVEHVVEIKAEKKMTEEESGEDY